MNVRETYQKLKQEGLIDKYHFFCIYPPYSHEEIGIRKEACHWSVITPEGDRSNRIIFHKAKSEGGACEWLYDYVHAFDLINNNTLDTIKHHNFAICDVKNGISSHPLRVPRLIYDYLFRKLPICDSFSEAMDSAVLSGKGNNLINKLAKFTIRNSSMSVSGIASCNFYPICKVTVSSECQSFVLAAIDKEHPLVVSFFFYSFIKNHLISIVSIQAFVKTESIANNRIEYHKCLLEEYSSNPTSYKTIFSSQQIEIVESRSKLMQLLPPLLDEIMGRYNFIKVGDCGCYKSNNDESMIDFVFPSVQRNAFLINAIEHKEGADSCSTHYGYIPFFLTWDFWINYAQIKEKLELHIHNMMTRFKKQKAGD